MYKAIKSLNPTDITLGVWLIEIYCWWNQEIPNPSSVHHCFVIFNLSAHGDCHR